MRSGEAFNVVPDSGELFCDVRADRLAAFEPVIEAVPSVRGVASNRRAGEAVARNGRARSDRAAAFGGE